MLNLLTPRNLVVGGALATIASSQLPFIHTLAGGSLTYAAAGRSLPLIEASGAALILAMARQAAGGLFVGGYVAWKLVTDHGLWNVALPHALATGNFEAVLTQIASTIAPAVAEESGFYLGTTGGILMTLGGLLDLLGHRPVSTRSLPRWR